MTANLALILWPGVALILFATLPVAKAVATCLVGGYLLLPGRGGFDLPVLPSLDKDTIPALTALVGVLAVAAKERDLHFLSGWWPRNPVIGGLIVLLAIGTVGTVLTNGDRLNMGNSSLKVAAAVSR